MYPGGPWVQSIEAKYRTTVDIKFLYALAGIDHSCGHDSTVTSKSPQTAWSAVFTDVIIDHRQLLSLIHVDTIMDGMSLLAKFFKEGHTRDGVNLSLCYTYNYVIFTLTGS